MIAILLSFYSQVSGWSPAFPFLNLNVFTQAIRKMTDIRPMFQLTYYACLKIMIAGFYILN